MTIGRDAIHKFVNHKAPGDLLIIKKTGVHLVNRDSLSRWTCFKAYFGCGKASMKKVAEYINSNRNNLFPDERTVDSYNFVNTSALDKTAFNQIVSTYNKGRTFKLKKAKEVKSIEAETISFFGKKEWKKVGVKVDDAPPVPLDLTILSNTPCPIWGSRGKTIGDTHVLFLVPKKLSDNKATTINRLRRIAKKHIPNLQIHHKQFKVFKNDSQYIHQSYWVLMTKDILPISGGRPFSLELLEDGYDVPHLIEADICMLTQYLRGRELTNKSTYFYHQTETYCQETRDGFRSIVGGSDEDGFTLGFPMPTSISYGMGAVKRY